MQSKLTLRAKRGAPLVALLLCACQAAEKDARDTNVADTGETALASTEDASGTGQGTSEREDASKGDATGVEHETLLDLGEVDESGGVPPVRLDILPSGPPPLHCTAGGDPLDVEARTPSGPYTVRHAWWAWQRCCSERPVVFLHDTAELAIRDAYPLDPSIHADTFSGSPQPVWSGETPVSLKLVGDPAMQGMGTVELLAPLELGATPPTLAMTFSVDQGGWSLQGTITAEYCAALDVGFCTCE